MNRNSPLVRKVIYVAAIALLLYPLFRLGQPAASDGTGGGVLAELRSKHELAQAKLGDIDPASETMKLATLGMRGVAAQILWKKSDDYKVKEDWDNFTATLNQITRLQPNFILVWEFQAHNVSYNVSVEFDDYRHRYQWVKRGIGYLIEGTHYNRNEPRLLWYTGWFFGQKFGKSDEQKQFRRLFRADEDFHTDLRADVNIESRDARGPDGRPDNWLVSRLWFIQAQEAVDLRAKPIRRTSPLVFHGDVAKPRINFATAIEEEGILDEFAEIAWKYAGEDWHKFGDRDLPSSWGHLVRLNSLPQLVAERDALLAKFNELVPGLREKIHAERLATLTPEERQSREIPFDKMTEEIGQHYFSSETKLQMSNKDLVERMADDLQSQGRLLAAELQDLEFRLKHVESYRGIINYSYWEARCQAEQKPEAVAARRHILNAEAALDDTNLEEARKEYESAWENGAIIFEVHPMLLDAVTGDELNDSISKYERVLNQQGVNELPANFPLKELRARKQPRMMPPPAAGSVPSSAGTAPTTGAGKPSPTPLQAPPVTAPAADRPPSVAKPKDDVKPDEGGKAKAKDKAKDEGKSPDDAKSSSPPSKDAAVTPPAVDENSADAPK